MDLGFSMFGYQHEVSVVLGTEQGLVWQSPPCPAFLAPSREGLPQELSMRQHCKPSVCLAIS